MYRFLHLQNGEQKPETHSICRFSGLFVLILNYLWRGIDGNEFEFQKYWVSFQEMSRFYLFFYFPKGHSLAHGEAFLHTRFFSDSSEEEGDRVAVPGRASGAGYLTIYSSRQGQNESTKKILSLGRVGCKKQ